MQRFGVIGGTFDPVHYGHLVTAEEALDQFELDRVIFVPAGRPPHKDLGRVTAAQKRYEMVRLAITSNPNFGLCDLEVKRPGPSYTVDTIKQLRADFPQASLFFITGMDAVLQLPAWKDPGGVLEEAEFIVANRPGVTADQLGEIISQLPPVATRKIHRLTIPGVDISASNIRQRVREGRSIRYLVPDEVAEFIYQHDIYQQNAERKEAASSPRG